MLLRHARRPGQWLLLTLALVSCRGHGEAGTGAPSGAIVVAGDDLSTSGVLLEALRHKVPTLRVDRGQGACPIVIVRGQAIGRQVGSANIYVDGTRMRDTCILQQLLSSDVDRVELYPVAGGRPGGMAAGPGGLIVITLRLGP